MKFNFATDADRAFIEKEIAVFKASERRRLMLLGEDYYAGRHDILGRRRTVIGENGELEPVYNLPDNKIADNQYRKLINQKANYLLGQPVSFRTDDERYYRKLSKLFDKKFARLMKNLAKDAYNCGLAWVYPFFGDCGEVRLKRLKAYEVVPGWRDAEHSELDYAVRIYEVVEYNGTDERIVERVEVFDERGIHYFLLENEKLTDDYPYSRPYIVAAGNGVIEERGWGKIPLVAFKCNSEETPVIGAVKSLQDGLNIIVSNFLNNMEEDARNTLLVLVNYDGENLTEFRKNLAAYGAVKVRTVDGAPGDLKTLRVEVNADNYRAIIEVFKKAIIENGMGFDAKDARGYGSPNQMNIQSMYSDVDLDANETETEFQASLEELMRFFDMSGGDFSNIPVEFIFNRDMLLNESAVIDNCVKSLGVLSEETVVANHPWIDDVKGEMRRKTVNRVDSL